ncbi:hypothetical protein CC78DRAFT_463964 [Lojkania enalia]|uniref:Rhodopsin domain-containing protein n=1 Tax=Lojkania enalia TaxID=147567 RepID=A0A9P4N446_9PLEO|nr:hypothetical protein CC78DRAFT_463964 [Didymosphaeria enalia]
MARANALPPGVAPPAASISPLDHSGWIVIANGLGMCLSLVAVGVRIIMRQLLLPSKRDDIAIWIATAVGIIQAGLVFYEVNLGFGKTIDQIPEDNVEKVQKVAYTADPLYLATIYIAKVSMIFLLVRITPDEKQRLLLMFGIGACTTFATISIILVLTRCNISEPWIQYEKKCGSLFARWQAIAAFDIATEIVLFAIPMSFLVGLQMRYKQKFKVVLAFSLRLPIIAFAILRLRELDNYISSTDPTLVGALAAVWTQVSMQYSLVATTLPCMTPFLTTVNTAFGAMELETMNEATIKTTNANSSGKKSQLETVTEQRSENGDEPVCLNADSADVISPVTKRRSTNLRDRSSGQI